MAASPELKGVGTYISEELYYKLRYKCSQKMISMSKALYNLIMIYCKDVDLSKVMPEEKPVNVVEVDESGNEVASDSK